MTKSLIVGGVVVSSLLLGACTHQTKQAASSSPAPVVAVEESPATQTATGSDTALMQDTANTAADAAMEKGSVKEFTVEGDNFAFSVPEMKVKQGDTVRVRFINKEGFHDWVLDEFNAKTQQIGAGKEETIEFVADKKGSFEYYCSVGKHRQMGMKGTLIVE